MTERVEEARALIAETRESLADTTSSLVAKADVKGRAAVKVKQERVPLAVLAGFSALLVGLLVWKRHG